VTNSVGFVVDLGGRADSAGISNEIVASFALTGAVDPFFVGVAGRGAESKVEEISDVADAGLGDGVVVGVDGAGAAGSIR
jgi:hypothetical protein